MENPKPIHYRKARKSDYLAGTDLEIFEMEGKSITLTISKVEFKEKFSVNGRVKERGLIIHFQEDYAKPFIVNTTNSVKIKEESGISDAAQWVGFRLEFYFDPKPEMKISQTETVKGGLRIKSVDCESKTKEIFEQLLSEKEYAKAKEIALNYGSKFSATQIEKVKKHLENIKTK